MGASLVREVAYADRVRNSTRAEGRAADVLYYLAVHADAERRVEGISLQDLAETFWVSYDHAKRWMRHLRKLGDVETVVRGGRNGPNTYRITLPPAHAA